jgi:ERCC4-type nuclease
MIVADARERDVIASFGPDPADLQIRTLDVCDFLFLNGNVVVFALERKTIADLDASLRDGRIADQRERMTAAYGSRVGYLIEGRVDWTDPKMAGALTGLVVRHRYPVFRTADKADTVALLRHLDASAAKGRLEQYSTEGATAGPVQSAPKKRTDNPRDAGIAMLSCVSGVSAAAAKAVLDVHTDVPGLVDALRADGASAVKDIVLGKRKLGKVGDKLVAAFGI